MWLNAKRSYAGPLAQSKTKRDFPALAAVTRYGFSSFNVLSRFRAASAMGLNWV